MQKKILWLSQNTFPLKASRLALQLESFGFLSECREAKLGSHGGIDAIILLPTELRWAQGVLPLCRELRVPILWAYETLDLKVLNYLSDSHIDDFFSCDATASEIATRLSLGLARHTHSIRLENQLRAHSEDLTKHEMVVKQREEFLGICTHDLRSPLGLIQTSLSMILNSKPQIDTLLLGLLERAKRQSVHAINLINDLLDVMSFEQGLKPSYQVVELHQFLSEFHRDFQLQADEKGVKFHYENPIPTWRVLADSDRVRQVFQNLFTNAVKFTPSGKNIYLSVSSFQGRRRTDPPYPMVIISLRDEGKGIPESEIQRIFDRFTQIKGQESGQGKGLGLSVAKQISKLHDGNVWVQSVEGKGSTFFVLLPHVISHDQIQVIPKKKVLVAEPSAIRRAEYFDELRNWGYDLTYARDGVEALTLFYHSPCEIVLLNQGLSKLSETEVATILKSEKFSPKVRVGLVTDHLAPPPTNHCNSVFDRIFRLPIQKPDLELINGVQNPGVQNQA